jgi:hypothetical protein
MGVDEVNLPLKVRQVQVRVKLEAFFDDLDSDSSCFIDSARVKSKSESEFDSSLTWTRLTLLLLIFTSTHVENWAFARRLMLSNVALDLEKVGFASKGIDIMFLFTLCRTTGAALSGKGPCSNSSP